MRICSLPLQWEETYFVSIQTNLFFASWQLSCKDKTKSQTTAQPCSWLGDKLLRPLNTSSWEGWGGSGFVSLRDRARQSRAGCPRAPRLSVRGRRRPGSLCLKPFPLQPFQKAGGWFLLICLPKTFGLPSCAPLTECTHSQTQNASKCFAAVNSRTTKAHKPILPGWVRLERVSFRLENKDLSFFIYLTTSSSHSITISHARSLPGEEQSPHP